MLCCNLGVEFIQSYSSYSLTFPCDFSRLGSKVKVWEGSFVLMFALHHIGLTDSFIHRHIEIVLQHQ
jgi:hypothetical protein